MRPVVTMLLACAAFGCDGSEEEIIDPPPPPDGQLVIGSSDSSGFGFVSVTDGADVELVAGAQGGFHVWTTVRATGVAGPLYLEREIRRVDDGTLVLRAQPLYMELPDGAMDDWWQRDEASPSFMCPSPIGVKVFDVEVAVTARLTDDDGEILAEAHVVVVPRCPGGDQLDWCVEICSG